MSALGESQPNPQRPSLITLSRFTFYLGLAVWTVIAISLSGIWDLHNLLLINADDSYYYQVIARNLASGVGSTFDGISPSNGYHPAWLFALSLIHCLTSDPVLALVLSKQLEVFLVAIAAFSIFFASRKERLGYLLPIFGMWWLCVPGLFFGLEAALQLAALCLCWATLSEFLSNPASRRTTALFSICVAMLPWVRLEAIVCVFTVLAVTLISLHRRRIANGFHYSYLLGALGFSLSGYALFNLSVVGYPLPLSGLVKQAWSQDLWSAAPDHSMLNHFFNTLLAPGYFDGLVISLVGIVVLGLCELIPSYRREKTTFDDAASVFLTSLCAYHIARMFYSALFLELSHSTLAWYFVPLYCLKVIVPAVILMRIEHLFSFRPRILLGRIVNVSALLALYLLASNALSFWHGWPNEEARVFNRLSRVGPLFYKTAQWIDDNTNTEDVIGVPGAGVIGYFSKRTIINLDGLVNSLSYYDSLRRGTIDDWLLDAGVTRLAGSCPEDSGPGSCSCLLEITLPTANLDQICNPSPISPMTNTDSAAWVIVMYDVSSPGLAD